MTLPRPKPSPLRRTIALALIAGVLASYTMAEADGLRKILSKKDRIHALRDFHTRFREGALARGVSEGQIEAIWQMILSFSGYSFCKPHSASYALVSFKSAYLKSHYPAEFMAAVLSNGGGYYSTFAYVSECRRMGLEMRLPEINDSAKSYTGADIQVLEGLEPRAASRCAALRVRGADPGGGRLHRLQRLARRRDGLRARRGCQPRRSMALNA